MSNPAVLSLASLDAVDGVSYRFEIEDNIGEAVHVHYKDIRLDLTVKEFYEIAYKMGRAIDEIIHVEGFCHRDFDPVNLVGLAGILPDLEKITYDSVYLEDLLVDTYDENGMEVLRPLSESRVVKALNGMTAENDMRKQVNYYDREQARVQNNSERLAYNMANIKAYGYPVNNELIVLFNSSNRIYDGQHRASCLYYLYGNIKVKVKRLWFAGHMHSDDMQQGQALCREYPLDGSMVCIGHGHRIKEVHIDLSGLGITAGQFEVAVQREGILDEV